MNDPGSNRENPIRQSPLSVDAVAAPVAASRSTTVVLVEGISDRTALETLAARRGRDLAGEGVAIIAMGGATNIGHYLDALGPQGAGVRPAGLCDQNEEPEFRRGAERAGLGPIRSRHDLEAIGFFVCEADLEDELIRAIGSAGVEDVIAEQGELGSFHRFQRQPEQRGRSAEAQLRRFMGTRSGRKARYGRALVEALDLDSVPSPLDGLIDYL